jgi:biopolymer transport protein ExbB
MNTSFIHQALSSWSAGGRLMVPLFLLAVFIYYTALELLFRLNDHVLLRGRVRRHRGREITDGNETPDAAPLPVPEAESPAQVSRHFAQVRNVYLEGVNRRIRFLAVLTAAAPLLGLLGTVTGMMATFEGLLGHPSRPLDAVAGGISEALITTQTGLIISVPALVILSMITHRRNMLDHAVTRLERCTMRRVLKEVA